VYRVRWVEETSEHLGEEEATVEHLFAVNLLQRGESNIAAADEIEIHGKKQPAIKGPVTYNREIWDIFALVAFSVLMVEWYIYTRRAWV
jgi:hypothetical protein